MSKQTKFIIGIIALIVFVFILAKVNYKNTEKKVESTNTNQASVLEIKANDWAVGPVDAKVTVVEYLDFECEACGAAYPAIEELRKEFAGKVTFQIRYFPLPGHGNSRPAAHAVEAAAQQGKLVAMYQMMYENQESWGEQQTSQAEVFRGFAKEIGLNMKEYDSDVDDPKTAARVERDVQAGTALGVASTPSFFINEEPFQGQSIDDLKQQLKDAIAAS